MLAATQQRIVMRDTAEDRRAIIEHLQAALDRCDGAGLPVLKYLIERALDEARAADWSTRQLGSI
jgi:hypothetical protein